MHKTREHQLRQSRVTAVFEDRALSFILGKGATLEELSDRLTDLGRRHNTRPSAITVKFGSSLRKAGSHRGRRPELRTDLSGCDVDGLRQRIDAGNSEHANVEHNTG
jgi:hypothetical protein